MVGAHGGLVAARDLVPDVQRMAGDLQDEWAELTDAVAGDLRSPRRTRDRALAPPDQWDTSRSPQDHRGLAPRHGVQEVGTRGSGT